MNIVESGSPVKIKAGELEILSNGILHASSNKQISFEIDDLKMSFHFVTDNNKDSSIVERKVEDKSLTWILINFRNTLGEGYLEPIYLGSVFKRKFYCSFWIWSPVVSGELRIINYVFYLGENTDE